jgi:hypothetical protein
VKLSGSHKNDACALQAAPDVESVHLAQLPNTVSEAGSGCFKKESCSMNQACQTGQVVKALGLACVCGKVEVLQRGQTSQVLQAL